MLIQTTHLPARHRAQLIVSDVSLTRGGTPVLQNVNLVINSTSRLAIIGENGRGKTSLLHVLTGAIVPDSGSIKLVGTGGVAEQEMPSGDDRTLGQAVAEAISASLEALAALETAISALTRKEPDAADQYAAALEAAEALDAWDAERRIDVALEALGAETDRSRRLSTLSVGQRYRVRLACLLGSDVDFLLLDEPTNHLDRNGLQFLTEQLKSWNGGVVVVTHDRALLNDFAETIVDLDPTQDDRPHIYGNGYLGYQEERRAEQARWKQEYERQQTERARLQDSLSSAQNRLVSGWRPDKGTNKHGRATRAGGLVQSVHRRQQELEAHVITVPKPPRVLKFPELVTRKGAALLSVEDVSVEERLDPAVSFSLSHRGRLVVTGPNGAGKSTLLCIASGELTPDTGTVRRPETTRLGFLKQESHLPLERRANEVYRDHVNSLVSSGRLNASEVIGLSQLELLRPHEAGKRIGELSTGQQRRLELALVLSNRPHVLLLDEPTNHLSIALIDELTEALQTTDAAVVLSAHDRQLLSDTASWPQLNLGKLAPRERVLSTET